MMFIKLPSMDNLASLSLVSLFVLVDAVIKGESMTCWFKGMGTLYGNEVALVVIMFGPLAAKAAAAAAAAAYGCVSCAARV